MNLVKQIRPCGTRHFLCCIKNTDNETHNNLRARTWTFCRHTTPALQHRIHLFDRQKMIPPDPMDEEIWSSVNVATNRFLIGLGGRGITALQDYGVWEDVQAVAQKVPGRKDWITSSSSSSSSSKRKKTQSKGKVDDTVSTLAAESSYVDDGIERMLTDRVYATHVLPRDKLVSVLHKHILKKYSNQVTLHYGRELEPIDFDWKDDGAIASSSSSSPSVVVVGVVQSKYAPTAGNKKETPLFDEVVHKLLENTEKAPSYTMSASKLFVVADGNTRTFLSKMEQEDRARKPWPWQEKLHVTQYVDDNPRIYKSIPFQLPPDGGWKTNLNYSVRAGKIIFDALPVSGRDYCGVLLLPQSHPMALAQADPHEFDAFLRDTIPQFYPFLTKENIDRTAWKDPSFLPTFSYLGPRLYHNQRIVMVGDCIKTVKPYFGLGANSALEDVRILGECIDQAKSRSKNQNDDDEAVIATAITQYSKKRAKDIQKLVTLSHSLDRPGPIGTAAFLIPIILDGMFRGIFPMLFKPNIINLMQDETYTFQQAARRKRLDRIGQLTLLGFFVWGLRNGTLFLIEKLSS
jgi:kynurenine 3-monooxygenase